MFRPAFQSALRLKAFSRGMATTRQINRLPKTRAAIGTALLLSSLIVLPLTTVSNDVDTEKVQKEKEENKTEVSGEETAKESKETASEQSEPSDTQLETEEGGQSAAFNPETGEINWDCPCLGGMAHGPCGEEFKEAFSCFVYSETEPKGIDCIGKFEAMRTCFKQHPEHYKEELYEDDEPVPSTDGDAVSTEATEVVISEQKEPSAVELDVVEAVIEKDTAESTEQPATVA